MRIVEELLTAQRRPRAEARRLTAAIGEALDDAWNTARYPDPSAAEAAAEAAYLGAAHQIAEEKVPRREIPAEHAKLFADDAGTGDAAPEFTDVEPGPPSIRTDPFFLPPAPAPVADVVAAGEQLPDADGGDFTDDAFENDPEDEADEAAATDGDPSDDVAPPFGAVDEQGSDAEPTGDANDPTAPLPAAATYEWDRAQELPLPGPPQPVPVGEDDANDDTGPIIPSPRAARPPSELPLPDRDPEPSLRQRLRGGAAALGSRARGSERRARWLAAAAVAGVIVVVGGTVMLTGGRATPPVPAETVAAPAQTDNPQAPPAEKALVPAFVSASCGTDTDPVGPFSGEQKRAWVCPRVNGLDGAVLNIVFNSPVIITRIDLVPGYNYVTSDGRDEWIHHRLITEVVWRLGGKKFAQQITPIRTGVSMTFPDVPTTQMSLTITGSTTPPKGAENADGIGSGTLGAGAETDTTTAISAIVIKGRPADPATG